MLVWRSLKTDDDSCLVASGDKELSFISDGH